MTTPTPTQAELEAAVAIVHYIRNLQTLDSLGPSAKELATILAAHRAAPPATLAPTFNLDPANDDEIARQHNDALNRIGDILIDLQNEAIERARSVFEEKKAGPAHAAELETALDSCILRMPNPPEMNENGEYGLVWLSIGAPIWEAIENARTLLATLAAERQAQKAVTP